MTVQEIIDALRAENVYTWFDLGLFIDRFRENRPMPSAQFSGSLADFKSTIADGGAAFITYEFGVDEISLEVERHASALGKILQDAPIHYIAGAFQPTLLEHVARSPLKYKLSEIQGFDNWPLYDDFFKTKLERGNKAYNELIGKFWNEVLVVTQKLGQYVEKHAINLLYLFDVCSRPGNVSLSLATVLLSEYLGLPVVSRNRDFYWEGRDAVFTNAGVGEFFSQIEVLYPWESRSWVSVNTHRQQSQHVVEKKGHNPANVREIATAQTLEQDINATLYRLYVQLGSNDLGLVGRAVERYEKLCHFSNEDLRAILQTENRHYLPGYGRTGFMLFLKSLIDPSFFRVEEQQTRGMIMRFAQELVEENAGRTLDVETLHHFYNAVDDVFLYRQGQEQTGHDHSLAYRHRDDVRYPYRDFTHQELMGLVNVLFDHIISHDSMPVFKGRRSHSDWGAALAELAGGRDLALDDRARLVDRLKSNSPMAYFPGECRTDALEWLVLRPIRTRLGLGRDEKITPKHLENHGDSLAPIYVFCPEKPCRKRMTAAALMDHVTSGDDAELSLLFERGVCRVIPTRQWSVGIHFPQLGADALKTLREIKRGGGYIVTDDDDAALMTDVVDLDRFHVGQVKHDLSARIMGIPLGSGYVQFAPAGVRTTLAYPTPIQTAQDFSHALKSAEYERLCEKHGQETVLSRIKQDARLRGSPIAAVLASLACAETTAPAPVSTSYLCGLYEDGQPWSGVVAKIDGKQAWKFSILTAEGKTKTVPALAQDFGAKHGKMPALAWNGGFILNAELVGKLGLPESFIGSPLGLIMSDGEVLCPPLFNKPAFLIYPDGRLEIQRVHCAQGLAIFDAQHRFELGPARRNPKQPGPDEVCFYDLMVDAERIKGDGRVVLRLAGRAVQEVIFTTRDQDVPILPVGLTLSFPPQEFPPAWNRVGKSLRIEMLGWPEIEHAIEAGPMLVAAGENCLDMQVEGWLTQNSIHTQAARLEDVNLRGPKIAVGLGERGNLSVLAINGRIRESVGATHVDMAEILIGLGIKKAMGFDPGGSSTLVVGGEALNISPYNSNYESDVYALPPEPRAVANAVVGWRE